jgi:hypothetical protein
MRIAVIFVLCSSTAFAQAQAPRLDPDPEDRHVESVRLLDAELEAPASIGGPIALLVLGAGGVGSGVITLGLGGLTESDLVVAGGAAIIGAGLTMLAAGIGMLVRRVPRRRAARVLSALNALSLAGPGLRW